MEKVLLVLANMDTSKEKQEEFIELVNACEMDIDHIFYQNLKTISFRTFIGSGKCAEIQEYLLENSIHYVIFDTDLTPLQIRNLEELWSLEVMDRTELILAIFAKRAKTPVARMQIESAQLKKLLPRLVGANTQLGRQSASGKNRGAGEKQLELDRRRLKSRLHELERELKKVEAQRHTQRRARQKSRLPLISLVGYTNAGKSTLMNQLLTFCDMQKDKLVLEKDMLFATLDTSIRSIEVASGHNFLLSDTVGFISQLPHLLIDAFHSTLEEVKYADLLLQVVDATSAESQKQMQVTQETLREIGAGDIPMITVFNKCDKTEFTYPNKKHNEIHISAKDTKSIELLLAMIIEQIFPDEKHVDMCLPYNQGSIYSSLMFHSRILQRDDFDDGMHLEAILNEDQFKEYKMYITHIYSS